jgi:hypothetical protein
MQPLLRTSCGGHSRTRQIDGTTYEAVPETLIVKARLAAASTLADLVLPWPKLTELNGRPKRRGSDRVHSLTIDARWREVAKAC